MWKTRASGLRCILSFRVVFAANETESSTVEAQLNRRLDAITIRHETGKSMVESMAKSAPAFGMIGTLIGLVFMMISMNPKTQLLLKCGRVWRQRC